MQADTDRRPAHSVAIRVMHWIGVYAMGCMIFSGWEIYNASPSHPFPFPVWTDLGGWLGAQRVLYAGVIIAVILQVLTGLSIWWRSTGAR